MEPRQRRSRSCAAVRHSAWRFAELARTPDRDAGWIRHAPLRSSSHSGSRQERRRSSRSTERMLLLDRPLKDVPRNASRSLSGADSGQGGRTQWTIRVAGGAEVSARDRRRGRRRRAPPDRPKQRPKPRSGTVPRSPGLGVANPHRLKGRSPQSGASGPATWSALGSLRPRPPHGFGPRSAWTS